MSQLTDVAADCGFGPDVAADRKKFLRIYFAEVADVAAITKTIRLGKHVDNEQRAAMEAVMGEKDVKAKKLGELLFEGNSWFLEMQEFVELQAEAGTAKVAHACLRGSSRTATGQALNSWTATGDVWKGWDRTKVGHVVK